MKIKILLTLSVLLTQTTFAIDSEKIGDILLLAIPSTVYGTTLYLDDDEGQNQFHKSFATNAAITYGLKYSVNRTRPNGEKHSFPSGHTSATFQSAAFVHKRYGLDYSIPAYLGAIFVGYSRIKADEHHNSNVLAGAVIGTLSSFYFTTNYKQLEIKPIAMNSGYGIGISSRW
ncbi:MAG: Unknown protein [uncultured Sulfurovum sp.]|uniref:Phosphatidic acid phosphatase type 2/haloperoxidase domain-containing protein n=1 Tax=uncultured Sulfurovum sp. TaxID=269237 RepID=A0A6S6SE01_9BACT|nr:MAG: Unknown protein [uncultured Sulfurovum sp.]